MTLKQDSSEIDGIWDIFEARDGGKLLQEGAPYLEIQGLKFKRVTTDHVYMRDLVINPGVQPHQIDLHITNDPGKGGLFLGIYQVDGDHLTICHAKPGVPRPTSFESTPQNGYILSVSKKRIGPK